MKGSIKNTEKLFNGNANLTILLIPEIPFDVQAIKAILEYNATQEQRDHVEGSISIIANENGYIPSRVDIQGGNLFSAYCFPNYL